MTKNQYRFRSLTDEMSFCGKTEFDENCFLRDFPVSVHRQGFANGLINNRQTFFLLGKFASLCYVILLRSTHFSSGRLIRVYHRSSSGWIGVTRIVKILVNFPARMSAKTWSPTIAVDFGSKPIVLIAVRQPNGVGFIARAINGI